MFARMLNVVPKGVELTEVINPLPVKPRNLMLTHDGAGNFLFTGGVRVRRITDSCLLDRQLTVLIRSSGTLGTTTIAKFR